MDKVHSENRIKWVNASVKYRSNIVLNSINLEIKKGSTLAIVGKNSSGKSSMALALAKEIPVYGDDIENNLKTVFVPFHTTLDFGHGTTTYRQQRWNMIDRDVVPTCLQWLKKTIEPAKVSHLLVQFQMESFTNKPIIQLSNGELRKLTLIRAMASEPDLLVLDNAFNGLDSQSRAILIDMLYHLKTKGIALCITSPSKEQIPSFFDAQFCLNEHQTTSNNNKHSHLLNEVKSLPISWDAENSKSSILKLHRVSLKSGNRWILKDISFSIYRKEHWLLIGKNGSGKTSLLNLIFADNPKAYNQNIWLFGRKKGSGESIWDIKERIGFVSPELHQFVKESSRVDDIIRTAMYETNRFRKNRTTAYQDQIISWLSYFNLSSIKDKKFNELSSSVQRIVLFIRALIKKPELLILDEPFQGFDNDNIEYFKQFIDYVAKNTSCSMVFVTHYPHEVPSCFNRKILLDNGEIIELI